MRWLKTVVPILLFSCGSLWGVVALNNAGTADRQGTGTYSGSFSVTAGGSNTTAFAYLTWDGTTTGAVTSITYGGDTMTSCGTASTSGTNGGMGGQWFYKSNPKTGSNTLAVTVSNSPTEVYANVISFNGVDQSVPVRPGSYQALVSSAVAGTSYSMVIINSNANDLTVTHISDDIGITGTNQTQDASNTSGVSEIFQDHSTTPASSVTHTWSFASGGAAFVMVGFSIQASANATVTPVNKDGLIINGGKMSINAGWVTVQ